MINLAGCCHKIERSDGFSFVSVLSKCHVCLFFLCFSTFLLYFVCFPFEIKTIPLNTEWVTPVSHQGGIQTLSISHSNSCIWQVPVRHPNAFQLSVKTPPCLLFIADPCPASTQPFPTDTALPLQLCSLFRLLLSGVWILHLSVRLPSCGLHTSKMSRSDCATGVWTMFTPPP